MRMRRYFPRRRGYRTRYRPMRRRSYRAAGRTTGRRRRIGFRL